MEQELYMVIGQLYIENRRLGEALERETHAHKLAAEQAQQLAGLLNAAQPKTDNSVPSADGLLPNKT